MSAFKKTDNGKPIVAAMPAKAVLAISRVLAFGAKKYGRDNWAKVDDRRRYFDAALRHIFASLSGERIDPDTGESHLAHAICSLMFLLQLEIEAGEKEKLKCSKTN